MTREQLLDKLKSLIAHTQENMGPVTDIWLPLDFMLLLDDRDIWERLWGPYYIGDTLVTNYASSQDDTTIRVAFLKELTDESVSTNGSTPVVN